MSSLPSLSKNENVLERWRECFSSEQILIRRSEDLFEQPERVWAELLAFLELPDWHLPEQGRKAHVGSGELEQLPPQRLIAMRAWLHQQLASTYAVMLGDYGLTWID